MITIEDYNLYKECIDLWGINSQISMAIEECSELILLLCHRLRDNKIVHWDRLVEETADVLLMIEQLKFIFDIDDKSISQAQFIKKERLRNLIVEEKMKR